MDDLPSEDASDEQLARIWFRATGMQPSQLQLWSLRDYIRKLRARRRAAVRKEPWRPIRGIRAADIAIELLEVATPMLVAALVRAWEVAAFGPKLESLKRCSSEADLLVWAGGGTGLVPAPDPVDPAAAAPDDGHRH